MKKILFTICLIMMGHYTIQSQNCSKMEDWVNESEGYGANAKNRRMDDRGYAQVYALAVHDENFVPVFGKSFTKMGLKEKQKLLKKMMQCFGDRYWVKNGFAYMFYGPHNGQDPWYDVAVAVNSKSLEELKKERQLAKKQQEEALAQRQKWRQEQQRRQRVAREAAQVRQIQRQKQDDPDRRVNTASDYAREASEVAYLLKPVQNNNAPAYDFSKYAMGDFLQTIYDGNFEGFPYGLRDMQSQNLDMGLKKTALLKKRSAFAYLYLDYFSTHCAKPNKENYKEFRSQYKYTDTDQMGFKTETIGKATHYYLKPQFYNDFVRMDGNYAADQGLGAIFLLDSMGDIFTNFPNDLNKLFSELDCENPVVKQLETNLVLASKGKSPLQKLVKHLK
ncbi:hypothetical protein [Allomuricauda sp. d1]|uniref:hypothetical protein n=1 Tax=Allomuricauda sp. d1 TaxID=3136725 RepID=UPI0031E14130